MLGEARAQGLAGCTMPRSWSPLFPLASSSMLGWREALSSAAACCRFSASSLLEVKQSVGGRTITCAPHKNPWRILDVPPQAGFPAFGHNTPGGRGLGALNKVHPRLGAKVKKSCMPCGADRRFCGPRFFSPPTDMPQTPKAGTLRYEAKEQTGNVYENEGQGQEVQESRSQEVESGMLEGRR
jgi:hypothetical protein